jgi:hypothetical protein
MFVGQVYAQVGSYLKERSTHRWTDIICWTGVRTGGQLFEGKEYAQVDRFLLDRCTHRWAVI